MTLDEQLSLGANIAVTSLLQLHDLEHQEDKFVPHPKGLQVLLQDIVILNLNYCNTLLPGLPACAIHPLQLIQRLAALPVFNQPKFFHNTPIPCTGSP